jgi:hypothetical protein
MHSGDLTDLGGASLTDAEREALLEVMQRAKDFDEKAQRGMNRLVCQHGTEYLLYVSMYCVTVVGWKVS